MEKWKRYFLLLGGIFLTVSACSLRDDFAPEACILQEIQFDPFNSLKLITISGGQVYQLRQEFTVGEETEVTASFQFTHFKDSLAVYDQLEGSPKHPYLTVKYTNGKPTRVTRFFPESGVFLYHTLNYSTPNVIRDDLSRLASTGNVWHMGYANYYLDEQQNVVRNERFSSNQATPTEFTKIEDRRFVYDAFVSPQQNLWLPFFNSIDFPDVKFFSPNNIITTSENGADLHFRNQYNAQGNIRSLTQPDGTQVHFSYVNCD